MLLLRNKEGNLRQAVKKLKKLFKWEFLEMLQV